MAGGSFSAMNKVVPGIYYRTQSKAVESPLLSASGVLLWYGKQVWGEDVVRLTLDDYSKNTCYKKIGRSNSDQRLGLFAQSCRELIIVNSGHGRKAASAVVADLVENGTATFSATQPGTLGNSISIVIVEYAPDKYEIRTTLDGVVVDKKRISDWTSFSGNDWVALTLEGASVAPVTKHAQIDLAGGVDDDESARHVDIPLGAGKIVRYHVKRIDDGASFTHFCYIPINATAWDGSFCLGSYVDGKFEEMKSSTGSSLSSAQLAAVGANSDWVCKDEVQHGGVTLEIDPAYKGASWGKADVKVTASTARVPFIADAPTDSDFASFADEYFNVMVCDDQSQSMRDAVVDFITRRCDKKGAYSRCLFVDSDALPANTYSNPYLTLCGQSIADDASLTAFALACIEAGKSWNASATFEPIGIDGDPTPQLSDDEHEDYIETGIMSIMKRADGVHCVCKDINTLHTDEYPSVMRKNRAVRLLETLRNTLRLLWETQYAGKVHNDDTGRLLWKSKVCEVLNEFVSGHGIAQYGENDVVVEAGEASDEVVMSIALTMIDSAEIVYVNLIL